jgi:hypothetical protein
MFGSFLNNCHTATPDVCRELHEATGWDGTHLKWNIGVRRAFVVSGYSRGNARHARNGEPEDYCELSETTDTVGGGIVEVVSIPAYDLGYLMRRAPLPISLTELRTERGSLGHPSARQLSRWPTRSLRMPWPAA